VGAKNYYIINKITSKINSSLKIMVQFCPTHEKILRRKKTEDGKVLLICPLCDYSEPFAKDAKKKNISKALAKKIVDNKTRVDDGNTAVVIKAKTKVACEKCGNDEAYYEQFQTRSADEPATTFYTCVKCNHKWREY